MKIAHIITRLIIGGAQENTVLNCEDLRNVYGDDVLLITGPPLGPEGSLMERIEAQQFPHVIVPHLRRAIHPVRDFFALRQLQRILAEFQPDVVHTHSAKAGILGRLAASRCRLTSSRNRQRPLIVHTVHGAPFYPYQNWLARNFYIHCERWAARKTDVFICVADAMTDLMVQAKVAPREKFVTVYSGMEVEPFLSVESTTWRDEIRHKLGFTENDVVFGKIARLFPLKGHEYLLAVAKSVVAKVPAAKFLIVGDGILRLAMEKQVAEQGLSSHFVFTGLVRPDEVPSYLAAMDVVVHTSLREGLARVLPQGLLARRPVISYDIDGAREVVIPNETGYLLPAKSLQPLCDAMVTLAGDANLRHRLGTEGRRRCTEKFDHLRMTEHIRSIYEKHLGW